MAEPPITIRAAHDSGPGNLPATRYVVHCTTGGRGYPAESAAGVARGTAEYFTKPATPGSAHYVHDAGGDEEHCVPENTIAWHAPPNPQSIGDEICGDPDYTREQWLSAEVWPAVHASAIRCREVCDRRGIPKVKLTPVDLLAGKHGICGHVDVSQAWHESTHWDPGPGFPWDRYMAVVNGTEEDDMTGDQAAQLQALYDRLGRIDKLSWAILGGGGQPGVRDVLASILAQEAKQADPAALAAALAPLLSAALVAALPPDNDSPVDVDALASKVVDDLLSHLK